MSDCVHHWRQELGNLRAPFECVCCGEIRVMEADFYRLYEAHKGRPWDRPEDDRLDRPLAVA